MSCLLIIFVNLSPSSELRRPPIKPGSYLKVSKKDDNRFGKFFMLNNNTTEKKSCSRAIDKVGFMKTHKTASSTIQNILLRYGMNSGWNFVFPMEGHHLGPPQHLTELTVPFDSDWIQVGCEMDFGTFWNTKFGQNCTRSRTCINHQLH